MGPHRTRNRSILLALVLAGAALPHAVGTADDTAFFASKVPPNVILFVDESGSMRNIMQHPYFDAADAPFVMSGGSTCQVMTGAEAATSSFPDTSSPLRYTRLATGGTSGHRFEIRRSEVSDWQATADAGDDPNQGYIERRYCGNVRKLYTDPALDPTTRTLWPKSYLDWYFHLEAGVTYAHPDPANPETKTGAEILAEIESASSGRNYITGAYFPKHQISRISAAKNVAKEVMYRTNSDCPAYGGDCGVYEDRVRFGIGRFRSGDHGGYVSASPVSYLTGKASLESTVDSFAATSNTPLSESLFNLYLYFMRRGSGASDVAARPIGVDGSSFPGYQYRLTGSYTSGSDYAPDPFEWDCQKQFIILVTDGAPTADNFTPDSTNTPGFSSFRSLIGDYAPDLASEDDWDPDPAVNPWTVATPDKEEGLPTWETSTSTGYLDDIALFMQEHDLRGDIPFDQTVDVYTVGFTTIGPVNTLLAKTARNGNGEFFPASEADSLSGALTAAIQDIIEKTQSFTAATVPASRATDGNNFYASYFDPSNTTPFWAGHIKLFEFNALGEVRDAPTAAQIAASQPGDCALDDPVPGRCKAGPLQVGLPGFWDAADQIPSAQETGGRRLLVSKLVSGSPSMVDFTTAQIGAADLGVTSSTSISSYNVYGHSVTGILDENDLAAAIVRYVRGCKLQSGTCVDRGVGKKLWDVFHSNPVVVGPPNAGIGELAYREFVQRYQHRKRVIYAGSNGGFVHGFNTGEYGTAALPQTYDRGDGVEEFGFMPYPARQKIAELPIDVPRTQYYVDASPSAADAWLDPAHTADRQDPANWNRWRTVLLGGMRQGGRVVWALDVTNPPDHDSASGEQSTGPAYPSYLWEFPCEGSASQCTGSGLPGGRTWADYMGETWSQPIVTRVKVTVDCDEGDVGCTVDDRWVAIFGAGYDPLGDPNLAHNAVDATTSAAVDYDASSSSTTSRAGRALFMVDIASGEVLAMKRFDDDPTLGEPEMRFAVASTPAVFDVDRDGRGDVVYVGDLGGNLWKWVIHASVRDPINGSTGSVLQPDWPFFKIFTAQDCDSTSCAAVASGPHYRSFFEPPTGALVGSSLWLAIGSGERNDLGFVGTTTDERNRFYVFKDVDPLERELTAPTSPEARFSDVAGDLVDVASLSLTGGCSSALPSTAVGFYVEGRDGEKFITRSAIFFGVVLTGSYLPPPSSADPCTSSGEAFLYGFRLLCGEGVFPPASGDPSDPPERYVRVGTGLPTQPRVSVGPVSGGGGGGGGGGCSDMVVVITSDGDAFTDCPGGRPDSGIRAKNWREYRVY